MQIVDKKSNKIHGKIDHLRSAFISIFESQSCCLVRVDYQYWAHIPSLG